MNTSRVQRVKTLQKKTRPPRPFLHCFVDVDGVYRDKEGQLVDFAKWRESGADYVVFDEALRNV